MKKNGILLILATLTSTHAFAQSGGNGSHGGDVLALQFTATMENITNTIAEVSPAACAPSVDLERIYKDVTVFGSPIVFVGGYEQDARSFIDENGKRKTEFSRSRLLQMEKKGVGYANLVLHEYYVHLGLEDTNQMLLSKACLDALTLAGKDVSALVYQINPISSIEEQLDNGKMALQTSGAWGSLTLSFHEGLKGIGGPSPEMVWRETNGKLVVAITMPTPNRLKRKLTGKYDIATGKYTISARYQAQVWYDKTDDGERFASLPEQALLYISTEDHIHWTVSYQNVPGHEGAFIGLKPLQWVFSPVLITSP